MANLIAAHLSKADLSGAKLLGTLLILTDLRGAFPSESCVYGASVWDIKVNDQTNQQNLVITPYGEAAITVDNIKVAQFSYLLLTNKEIRDVIDSESDLPQRSRRQTTITSTWRRVANFPNSRRFGLSFALLAISSIEATMVQPRRSPYSRIEEICNGKVCWSAVETRA